MASTPPLAVYQASRKTRGAERTTPHAVEKAAASQRLRRGSRSRLGTRVLFYICEFKGRGEGEGIEQDRLGKIESRLDKMEKLMDRMANALDKLV